MTPVLSEWMYGDYPQTDQPLIVPWPGQGLVWAGAAYGVAGTAWCAARWKARVDRRDPAAPLRTLLTSMFITGQIGGLVGTGLLINDFPEGAYQGQMFQSTLNTAWQMIWGQGVLIGETPAAHLAARSLPGTARMHRFWAMFLGIRLAQAGLHLAGKPV